MGWIPTSAGNNLSLRLAFEKTRGDGIIIGKKAETDQRTSVGRFEIF